MTERGGVKVDLRGVEADEDDACVMFEIGTTGEILLPLSIFLNGLCVVLLKVAGNDAGGSLRAVAEVERITAASATTAPAVAEASPGEMKEVDRDGDCILADEGATAAVVVALRESLFIEVCSPSSSKSAILLLKAAVEDADDFAFDLILSNPTNFFSGILEPSFCRWISSLSPSSSEKPTLLFSTFFSFSHLVPRPSSASVSIFLAAFEVLLSLLLLLNDVDRAFDPFAAVGATDD